MSKSYSNNDRSTQPCGCDEGANHQCEGHKYGLFQRAVEQEADRLDREYKKTHLKELIRDARGELSPQERKTYPLATGVLDYFPDALMEVAHVSKVGNDQHNPGQPLHWAKEKSTDEADALLRHLKDRGKRDSDGTRHSAKVAWRALALLQREIEAER